MKKRVVITGLGVVSPNGVGKDNFLKALRNGQSGIRFLEELKVLGFNCQVGGIPELSSSYVEEILGLKLQKKLMGDNLTYGVIAGLEAWKDAGLDITNSVDWDSGCVFGNTCTNPKLIEDNISKLYSGKIRLVRSRTVEQAMTSCVTANLSGLLGLGNCSITNSSACSTGTESILIAFERIQNGKAKRILAGSSEGASPITWAGFDKIRALNSSFNESPEKASRPMSGSAKGFVPGSGAGALVLEDLDSALKRNADIYAEILGGSMNSGGQRDGGSMTKPNSIGVIRCIKEAIETSSITSEDIDLISGHLTATYADPVEINNWLEALNVDLVKFPYLNSLKSMVGHCLGAAGSIESVAAVLQLYEQFIHPSINCEDLHPEIMKIISEGKIPHKTIDNANIDIVAKASFGFGDVNSCIILKKYK